MKTLRKAQTSVRRWHADLHEKMAAYVKADDAVAWEYLMQLQTGNATPDDSPVVQAADWAAQKAYEAIPRPFHLYADRVLLRANDEAWQRVHDLEAEIYHAS